MSYNSIKTAPLSQDNSPQDTSKNQRTRVTLTDHLILLPLLSAKVNQKKISLSGVGWILDATLINSVWKSWNMLRHCLLHQAYILSVISLPLGFWSMLLSVNVILTFLREPIYSPLWKCLNKCFWKQSSFPVYFRSLHL